MRGCNHYTVNYFMRRTTPEAMILKKVLAISYSSDIIISVRGRKPTEYIQDIQEDMTMANFTNGRDTMEKLAKHLEACTTYRVEYIPEMMCGDYTEENMGLVHHLFDTIEVSEYGDSDKKILITLFAEDIFLYEVIPHRGYRSVSIITNRGTQAQMFTRTALAVDRNLYNR